VLCALSSVALGGCASSRGPIAAAPLGQGSSWDLVLPSAAVTRATPPTPEAWRPEWSRLDGSLAIRSGRAATALDRWPVTAPTLDSQRRVYLSRQSRDMLFFRFVTTSP